MTASRPSDNPDTRSNRELLELIRLKLSAAFGGKNLRENILDAYSLVNRLENRELMHVQDSSFKLKLNSSGYAIHIPAHMEYDFPEDC